LDNSKLLYLYIKYIIIQKRKFTNFEDIIFKNSSKSIVFEENPFLLLSSSSERFIDDKSFLISSSCGSNPRARKITFRSLISIFPIFLIKEN